MVPPTPISDRTLTLNLTLNAPPAFVFQCWTDPALIVQWFTPVPYKTISAETDLRVGGRSMIVMESPEGVKMPNEGQYLEIIKDRKIVFTDAFRGDWEPTGKPFFVGTVVMEPKGKNQTAYTCIAQHWDANNSKAHAEMGFEPGWTAAARQLEALAIKMGVVTN